MMEQDSQHHTNQCSDTYSSCKAQQHHTKDSVQAQSATSPRQAKARKPASLTADTIGGNAVAQCLLLCHTTAVVLPHHCCCMFLSTLAVSGPTYQQQHWGKQPCRAASAAPRWGPQRTATWQPPCLLPSTGNLPACCPLLLCQHSCWSELNIIYLDCCSWCSPVAANCQ